MRLSLIPSVCDKNSDDLLIFSYIGTEEIKHSLPDNFKNSIYSSTC